MKLLFSIGPFSVHFFGLMIAIAALAGIYVAVREAKKEGLNEDKILEGCIYALLGGILGARLIYVLVYNPSYYFTNPAEVIMITSGGLSIHGGILGGAIAAVLYIRKNQMPLWKTADVFAPGLILAQGIGRVGCDVFGKVMASPLPWGINYNGSLVHPAQAYEFILDYLLFFYLLQKRKNQKYDGQVFVHYLIIFAIIRGVVEFSRTNPAIFGVITVSHALSVVMIVVGIILAALLSRNNILSSIDSRYTHTKMWQEAIVTALMIIISLVVYYVVQG